MRDLAIFGQVVYLNVPRRQFYCQNCQKYPTEPLSFVEKRRNYTIRYEEYIYEKVKELLAKSPCLSIAYELKEELRAIYETSTTIKMGYRRFKKWLVTARFLFGKTADTIAKHLQNICHYFINKTKAWCDRRY